MLRRGLVLGSIAIVCLTASAEAQSIAPLRFGVALGSAFGDDEWWWPDGGHAALSLTSQQPGSRFGLRVEAMFDYNTSGSSGLDGRISMAQQRTSSLTINSTYRLLGRSSRLYAIAGLGVYQYSSEVRTHDFGSSQEVRTFSNATLGANLGLGLNFTAFGREMFVESRLHSAGFGDRVPLSLGIRF
ncbi:MAG TPA: hypothetical protein VJ802_07765 [Gemmatimonadaceae bacterium]|nr:hypothetical protein [Gemmatimonadaceae bacterium]